MIKKLFKQLFCKHEYGMLYKFWGYSNEYKQEYICGYTFKCYKCDKELKIEMSAESQLKDIDEN